jgi:hypothetical protein
MKKEAPRFTNQKCTTKNSRGSKTSDNKMNHISQIRNTPKKCRGSKTSDKKRSTAFHELETYTKMQGDPIRPKYILRGSVSL